MKLQILFLIISAKYSAIYIEIVKFPLKNATFRKAQKISLFSETLWIDFWEFSIHFKINLRELIEFIQSHLQKKTRAKIKIKMAEDHVYTTEKVRNYLKQIGGWGNLSAVWIMFSIVTATKERARKSRPHSLSLYSCFL